MIGSWGLWLFGGCRGQESRPATARLALAVVLAGLVCPATGLAATFTVNTEADFVDSNPGDGLCFGDIPFACSLRAAIIETNALASSDTIHLPAGHYMLAIPGTLEDEAFEGDLDVRGTLTIEGAGAETTIIDGQNLDTVINAHSGVLRLHNATVTGGSGYGIKATSPLILEWVRVSANEAGGIGFVGGTHDNLWIFDSHIEGNQGNGVEGFQSPGGLADMRLIRTTVSNNTGSGVFYHCNEQDVIIVNSTISSNAVLGVAFRECGAEVAFSTVTWNSAGGLLLTSPDPDVVSLANTIVATIGGSDCRTHDPGSFVASSSLDSDGSCGAQTVADPMLHPLGALEPIPPYFAPTHHPMWGSPVVDLGSVLADPPATDQEGVGRLLDGDGSDGADYDAGSIEVLACSGQVDVNVFFTVYDDDAVVEACRSITTGAFVTVSSGSVTFAARDVIAIGNGFTVQDGAEFSARLVRWAGVFP